MELDVNLTATPLPQRPMTNQLIDVFREETKVAISANHYAEAKLASGERPNPVVI